MATGDLGGNASVTRADSSEQAQPFNFNEATREMTANGLPVWFVDLVDEHPTKTQAIAELERELERLKHEVAKTEQRLAAARAQP
jgi:hypothetical protein